MDELSKRRIDKVKRRSNYKGGLAGLCDPIIAEWRERWAEDCKAKGRTIPFDEWVFIPSIEGDEMSSPFEIGCPVYFDPGGHP